MNTMDRYQRVDALAWVIRSRVIEMVGVGMAGHIGGSLSAAEIVAALYGYKMQHDPSAPDCPTRDRFVMSKGHAVLAQYAALAEFGYFPLAELKKVKALGAMLQGHPDLRRTPGIEANTGSLGQGLSIALGMALGLRVDASANRVYCLVGDGEIAEGQIWEAAMAAANFKLDNLVAIIDCNKIQATDTIIKRFNTNPVAAKWEAFGWKVMEVDGHDVKQICDALDQAGQVKQMPVAIVAHTIKGKGIAFAENTAAYHNAMLTEEQYKLAVSLVEEQKGAHACKI
jgi:transketolase